MYKNQFQRNSDTVTSDSFLGSLMAQIKISTRKLNIRDVDQDTSFRLVSE